MGSPLYRKTAAGTAEVRERRAGLDARTRTLLILCNGTLTEPDLSARMNQPVGPLLVQLVGMGLLEAVQPVRAASSPPPAPARPRAEPAAEPGLAVDRTPSFKLKSALSALTSGFGASRLDSRLDSQLSTMMLEEALTAEEHAAMVRRAWSTLEPLFGPGTAERIEPLDRAVEPHQVQRALSDIRDAIAIYRGRRSASELVQRILNG